MHRYSSLVSSGKKSKITFPLLHRLWSSIRGKFLRDLQFALKLACTFVFATLVVTKSHYQFHAPVKWLVPTLSTLTSLDTVGGCFLTTRNGIVNFVPMSIFIYILYKIGMGYHDYTSSSILFFITTFWVGYVNPTALNRKIALVYPAVLFTTIVNTPRVFIPDTFVWTLLGETLVALCVTIAVSIFIFPRFATMEVQTRFGYALNRTAEAFELAVRALVSNHSAKAEVYLVEAENILANLIENQEMLSTRMFLSQFEFASIIRFFFSRNKPLYARLSTPELTSLHFNEYHADVADASRESFLQIADIIRGCAYLIDDEHGNHQNVEEIALAIHELQSSINTAYEALGLSLRDAQVHYMETNEGSSLDASNKAADQALFLASGELEYQHNRPISKISGAEGKVDSVTLFSDRYDLDAIRGGNRLSFSHFLFHISEFATTIQNRFAPPPPPAAPTAPLTLMERLQALLKAYVIVPTTTFFIQQHVLYTTDVYSKLKTGLRNAILLGVAFIFVEVPALALKFEQGQWIMLAIVFSQGDNLGGTLAQMRLRLLGTMMGAIYSYFIYIAVQDQEYKVLAMFVPFIIFNGIIRQSKSWSYFGNIAVTTAIIVTYGRIPYADPIVGNYSLLRIQQNALGIMLGLVTSLITIPTFGLDYLKVNIHDVTAKFSAATKRISKVYEENIVNTKAAVMTAASLTIREEEEIITPELGAPPQFVASLDDIEAITINSKTQIIAYVMAESLAVRMKLSQQPVLIEQATFETLLSSKPFPESLYYKLLICENRVLQMIVSLDRALFRISNFPSLKSASHAVLFGQRVGVEMQALLMQLSDTIKGYGERLQATTLIQDVPLSPISVAAKPVSLNDDVETGIAMQEHHPSQESSYNSPEARYHRRREEHAERMKTLRSLASNLYLLSQELNHNMFRGWIQQVLEASGVVSPSPAPSNATPVDIHSHHHHHVGPAAAEAATAGVASPTMVTLVPTNEKFSSGLVLRRLFDIVTTFNAAFYGASHLSHAVIEMCNILMSLTEVEDLRSHRPF